MRNRSIQAVYRYWNALRGSRVAPQRSQLDPRALAPSLGDIFLIDASTSDFRFRLAGSRLSEAFGTSLTDASFFSLWLEASQDTARYALDLSNVHGAPVLLGVNRHSDEEETTQFDLASPLSPRLANASRYGGRPERRTVAKVHAEMILLPLLHNGKPGMRVLGAFALLEEEVRSPKSPAKLEAVAARSLAVSARPRQPVGLISADVARTVISRRGHLVLMKGMKDG